MRVLHVIPTLKKGGAQRLCLDIVSTLIKDDFTETKLVVLNHENTYKDEYPGISPIHISSKVIPSITGDWKKNTEEWDSIIESFNPDVIHSHLFEAEILSRHNILVGVKYFTHCHDNMHQLRKLKINEIFSRKRLTEYYERRHMMKQYEKCKNRFIAISKDTVEYFTSVLSEDLKGNITFLPNATDTNKFSKHCADYPTAQPLKLVNIGMFVPKKNQTFLLDVVLELNHRGIPSELTLIGDGILRAELEKKVRSLGLESQIVFLGNINNVEEILWKSNLYVHSATYEPFGLVLIEGMAAGLPVVSLDGKGNRDIVINGVNGYLLETDDVKAFADRIVESCNDPGIWNKLSKNAIEMSSKYDIRNYVDQLVVQYS